MAKGEPISVSRAVARAKDAVNGITGLVVTGEVTGFRGPNARSGHCYFQVKDDSSSMDVIVWRGTYAKAGIQLRDGMKVLMTGGFDVYVGSGRLSFVVRSIEIAGEGLLRQQVAELARRLEAEGLMAPERKRPVPRFCTRVAVVTSLSGSVIDDVKRTLRRRNPLVELQVVGCAVQGAHAPQTIVRALRVAADARPEAILLVRGGGSFEDLMTFNDEALARAVAACPVPVVTGIGHEPDTSICDMVADRRCSTPTAAAESVAPALDEIVMAINGRQQRLLQALSTEVDRESDRIDRLSAQAARSLSERVGRDRVAVDSLSGHRCLQDPRFFVDDRTTQLMQTEQRLVDALPRQLGRASGDVSRLGDRLGSVGPRICRPFEAELARSAASLEALSPVRVLSRGYAIATDASGHVISSAEDVSVGESVKVRLGHGELAATVSEVLLPSE